MSSADDAVELPPFEGARDTLALIGALYRRRPSGDRDGEALGRAELPMICLVRPEEYEDVLPAISQRLHEGSPHRVPHALVRLEGIGHRPREPHPISPERLPAPTPADVEQIRGMLVEIAHELAESRNAKAGRLRFPRLALAVWLMEQDVRLGGERTPRVLHAELRDRRHIDRRVTDSLDSLEQGAPDLPGWLRWAPRVLRALPPFWFRLKSSGRLPRLSAEYRWFPRQPYLAAEVPGTFIGFAERLTARGWRRESPDQMLKFLTNAFLEDLRQSYPKPPLRLRGARRTTNAVVLLDHITLHNGGYRLLRLVNDVRNDTGRLDPLLLVSGSRFVPPYRDEPDSRDARLRVYSPVEAPQRLPRLVRRTGRGAQAAQGNRLVPADPDPGRRPRR
ncbi:hypothetical protein HUO13_21990 [Saccharopolyspora erythraea]|uniref:hypothetical protein n=1 Tax=Saccharopolyspora erythraea TaxID=1836 RepID=UPI001BAA08C9|nr:hypothetical protein [Saccharopolyspora erythraea]QUH03136.1 hypothetical protein HUO13_21990 [Saccharopolyspora erythraea]